MSKMNDTDRLRQNRLVFYREDIEQILVLLRELMTLSGAKCALLIDKEGHLVTREGAANGFDSDSLSALVAGSFAATKEMARLLGEAEFSVMFHQGQRDNIQLTLVGDRTILTVIFDDQTQLGMIRLYTQECVKKLQDVFDRSAGREAPDLELGGDFEDTGRASLDDLFK
ncbi:MAG: roadblock/LC7 domain-containing protein [Planctomycetota bacterium]